MAGRVAKGIARRGQQREKIERGQRERYINAKMWRRTAIET
jgi:hypothetical protein